MNTGGPAFPQDRVDNWGTRTSEGGMTMRDYFAAKAMQGMLSGLLADGMDIQWVQMAQDAYRQADAMLKAREQ
jgi:hypothetical protein